VLDNKNRVVDLNSLTLALLADETKPALGCPVEQVFDWWTLVVGQRSHSVAIQQDVSLKVDTFARYYNLQITPIWDRRQRLTGRLVMMRDVTAERLAQDALSLAQVKTEFLAKVGHELRTPLTAILGVSEMLDYGVYGPMTEEQRGALRLLFASTSQMVRLVNDILQQARMERGTFRLEIGEYAIHDLLNHLHAQVDRLAEEKGLVFVTEVDPQMPDRLSGDPMRVYQILSNLVENALKYTLQGRVDVHIFPLDGKYYCMRVSDTGIGIPSELQAHIFDAFRQSGVDPVREQQGLGLGLSIVKQLVHLMKGEVRLESELGKGSDFFVNLPMESSQQVMAGEYG
jgi:signal transduction histidine kinase